MQKYAVFHAALFLLIIGLFTNIQTSFAQMTISDDEKAVIAYLKLTEQEPDYNAWVKNTPIYTEAHAAQKVRILEDEKARLDWGFATYDVKKDLVTIKAKIRLSTAVKEDGKRMLYTRFNDERHNEISYFPYTYGKDSIAFIIQGLEKYQQIELSPEEIPKIKEYFHDSAPYEAEIEMRIRPLSADAEQKLLVDYKDQWLMLGDIAYLKINHYDEFKLENINVWDYNAPWYLDESQKALMNMFKEPKTE